MTQILFVLHAYQPPYPVQEHDVVQRIVRHVYLPFAETLVKQKNVKVILNVNACLTEMLRSECPKAINLLRQAIANDLIELLDTGYYHPILPFLSNAEFAAQIEDHSNFNCRTFGLPHKPLGFWPPELAISTPTIQKLTDMGYKAVIAPENILADRRPDRFYALGGTLLLSRNKEMSNKIAFRHYNDNPGDAVRHISQTVSYTKVPMVLAMDIETFGEHHKNYLKFLFGVLSHKSIECIGIEDLLEREYLVEELKTIHSSSWSTENSDRDKGIPFPLWNHPQNPVHQIQHAHMLLLESTIQMVGGLNSLTNDVRRQCLMAEHSCQFWWAHGYAHMWCPDMIKRGFKSQVTALRNVSTNLDPKNRDVVHWQSNTLWERLLEVLRTH